jgi:hypothetical protein
VGSLRQRPSIVSDDILRAIYHVHLKDVVHQGEFEEIEERLHRAAESPGPVWSSRIGLQSSAAWTTYGLAAGLLRGDQKAVERAADAVAKQDGDRNILLRLLENLPDGETESAGVPHPFEAFQNRQYDVALEGAREMSPGLQRTELLLFIANCVDQRPILKEALSAAEDLDLDQRAKLNPLAKDALEKIRDQISSAEARIQGWMDLLVSIRDHNLSHAQVLRTAREERITWDLDSLVGDPDILVDTLADIPESQKPTLRSVLPYIVEDLLSDPNYPDRSLRDVYDLILIVIIEDPSPDPESISNVVDLFPGVLGLLTKKDYQERAEEAASMLDRVTARIDPSQALDFLDVLIAHPAPDPRPRQSAFTKVNELRERNPEDWNREHHRFLRKLALEGGLENLIPPVPDVQESESTETDPLGWLRGKYVGIYTLNESAGRRAEKEIRSRVNDVDVRRSNAHQSTESLVAMSKNSDVMVVVTRQATHAATDAITSNLGPETELVRPKGGGTRSIIAELETGPEGD